MSFTSFLGSRLPKQGHLAPGISRRASPALQPTLNPFPLSRSAKEREWTSAKYPDPVEEYLDSVKDDKDAFQRPWTIMDQLERAKECARVQAIEVLCAGFEVGRV